MWTVSLPVAHSFQVDAPSYLLGSSHIATPLSVAAAGGNLDICQALVEAKAKVSTLHTYIFCRARAFLCGCLSIYMHVLCLVPRALCVASIVCGLCEGDEDVQKNSPRQPAESCGIARAHEDRANAAGTAGVRCAGTAATNRQRRSRARSIGGCV